MFSHVQPESGLFSRSLQGAESMVVSRETNLAAASVSAVTRLLSGLLSRTTTTQERTIRQTRVQRMFSRARRACGHCSKSLRAQESTGGAPVINLVQA